VLNWVTLGTLWADVMAGPGREAAGEEVRQAQVPYRITVRAAPAGSTARPKPEQRLRDGDRIFTLLAVTERDAAGRYLTCFAREEVPA
jgi:head-tail adaptor